MRRGLRRTLAPVLLAGVLVVGGCGLSTEPELTPEAAEALQDAVHAVAVAAAQGRHDAAAAALADVRAALDVAVENDDVTVRRYREIDTAIQRTAELLAAERTEPGNAGDEPQASAGQPGDAEDAGTAAVAEPPPGPAQAPAPRPSPEPAPAPQPSPSVAGTPSRPPGDTGAENDRGGRAAAPADPGNGSPPGVPAGGLGPGDGGPGNGHGPGNGNGPGSGAGQGNGNR